MPTISLFPYALVRVAGGAFERFRALEFSRTLTLAEETRVLRGEIAHSALALSDAIYEAIPSREPDAQKKLLNAKRDVFNRRALSEEKILPLERELPPVLFYGRLPKSGDFMMRKM